jgi:hypothetical protein
MTVGMLCTCATPQRWTFRRLLMWLEWLECASVGTCEACHVMSCQCYACHAMPCGRGTRSVDMVCMDTEQRVRSGVGDFSSVHTFPARAWLLAGLRLGMSGWKARRYVYVCVVTVSSWGWVWVWVVVNSSLLAWVAQHGRAAPDLQASAEFRSSPSALPPCLLPSLPTPRRALDTRTRQGRMPKENCAHDTVAIIGVRSFRSLGWLLVG